MVMTYRFGDGVYNLRPGGEVRKLAGLGQGGNRKGGLAR